MKKTSIKLKKKLSMGVFGIVFAVAGWFITDAQVVLKYNLGGEYNVSPKFFPRLVLICIGVSGIMLLIQSIVQKKDEYVIIELKDELRVLILLAALVLYVYLFKPIGFIVDTMLISCLVLVLQKSRNWKYYAIVCGLTIFVFILFVYLFGIRLPWGFPLNRIFR